MKSYLNFKNPEETDSSGDELADVVEDMARLREDHANNESDVEFDNADDDDDDDDDDYEEIEEDEDSDFSMDDSDSSAEAGKDVPSSTAENETVATQTSPTKVAKACGTSDAVDGKEEEEEEEEEDDTVRAILAAIKKPRSSPQEIKLDDFITDICFHPENDIIALATITGDIHLYTYSTESNMLLRTIEVHAKACRDVEFSADGRDLLTCSKDKSIMITDMVTEKLKKFYESAHEDAINTLYVLDENLFASGDDEGTVKLWDLRTKDAIFALKDVEDYITQILSNDDKKLLLVTSGDGYLSTINIGARKLYVISEPYEEEANCMGLYRGDSKLVVGTSKGNLYTYNWGQFGYHCDKYPGMKTPISKMIPLTDRIGCVAGEEGIIRACHVAPFRNLGIVGQHSMPIECMDINSSGELIASSSHNNDVRFWNVKYFEEFPDIKFNEKHNPHKEKRHNLPSSKFTNNSDFFADLASQD